jgi:HTH-type transcriptional regulator, sugar sensing transcriptional regulator
MKLNNLEQLGLSNKEARVYIACLEIGSGTAFQIGQKLGIPKSTVHDILNNLVSRGFVSTFNKKSKRYFSATDPNFIGEKVKKQMEIFETILPELNALAYSGVGKPVIRYFDTKEGIEVALKEMFAEAKDLIFYGNVDAVFETYPEYFPKYTKKRVEKNIITHGIGIDGPIIRKLKEEDQKSLRRTKIVTSNTDVSSLAWIWNDKFVIFNTVGNHSVLVVEDRRFANLLRSMFELVWGQEKNKNQE